MFVAAAVTWQASASSWRGAAAIHGAAGSNMLAKPVACGWFPTVFAVLAGDGRL